jgi:hypothetical protein
MKRYYERRRHQGAWRILWIPLSTLWQRLRWVFDSEHHDRGAM